MTATPMANTANMAAKTAYPCFRAPTSFPNMKTRPAGISRIESISRMFVKPLGFSKGTAEFEL